MSRQTFTLFDPALAVPAFADAWRGNPLTATLEELVAAGKGMCACRSGWLETLLASLPENAMAGPVEARSRLVH